MPWDDVVYTVETFDNPHVTGFLSVLGEIFVNGGVILRSFPATDPAAFDDAFRKDFRGIDHGAQTFLTRPSVVAALPELRIELPIPRPPEFRWTSGFGMEGDLTHMLLVGGAYERYSGTVEQARSLSRRFMETLFGKNLHRLWVGRSTTPWAPWFHDIAWDNTFIVLDQRARRFVLLCITDTD